MTRRTLVFSCLLATVILLTVCLVEAQQAKKCPSDRLSIRLLYILSIGPRRSIPAGSTRA
jgi:hypothetical protein